MWRQREPKRQPRQAVQNTKETSDRICPYVECHSLCSSQAGNRNFRKFPNRAWHSRNSTCSATLSGWYAGHRASILASLVSAACALKFMSADRTWTPTAAQLLQLIDTRTQPPDIECASRLKHTSMCMEPIVLTKSKSQQQLRSEEVRGKKMLALH